jgi:hypothetical protein
MHLRFHMTAFGVLAVATIFVFSSVGCKDTTNTTVVAPSPPDSTCTKIIDEFEAEAGDLIDSTRVVLEAQYILLANCLNVFDRCTTPPPSGLKMAVCWEAIADCVAPVTQEIEQTRTNFHTAFEDLLSDALQEAITAGCIDVFVRSGRVGEQISEAKRIYHIASGLCEESIPGNSQSKR